MLPEERRILDEIRAQVLEIEGAGDAEIQAAAKDADAILIVSAYLRAPVIRGLTRCKIISRIGTGVDKIDVAQATRQGIFVANLPDFSTAEVADHTLALLLAAARQLKFYDAEMRRGRQPREIEHMHRLSTRTLGLIGFGRIGRAVAARARPFGMKILVCDPALTDPDAQKLDVTAASLDRLLAESDYVCLLCPLLPSTRGLLAAEQIAKMKPDAVLINTGRGELVDEPALVAALRSRKIRYAALDVFAGINVFAPGGFATDHPFFGLDNVLLTPHVAAYSKESLRDARVRGAQAVVDVLSGRWPQHLVNPQVQPWFPIRRA
jgi:D-3-phosphoglycerate dehydrogenase